jgi:hypothetical protein
MIYQSTYLTKWSKKNPDAGPEFLQCTNTSVACAVGSRVTTSSTDFSFPNMVFWNLFEFSAAEIT